MTFPWINIAPEIFLLLMTCVVLLTSLFWEKAVYTLSQLTLFGTAAITFFNFNKTAVLFQGMFIQDQLTALLKLFVFLATFFVFLYAKVFIPAVKAKTKQIGNEYYVLGLFSILGMMVLISAGHLMTFFLGLEILSLPLYAMVALDRHSSIAAEASMKYFVTGALATGILLYGFSFIYGVTQSLGFSDIAQKVAQPSTPHLLLLVGLVFALAGVLFKLGATPFHMWVPDVYQGSTTPVTLFVAAAPKIAALGIVIRFLVLALPALHTELYSVLITVSIASMMLGNFVAIVQTNLKRMLAYSSIAHVGYMLLGVIAGNADGYAASVFYVLMYSRRLHYAPPGFARGFAWASFILFGAGLLFTAFASAPVLAIAAPLLASLSLLSFIAAAAAWLSTKEVAEFFRSPFHLLESIAVRLTSTSSGLIRVGATVLTFMVSVSGISLLFLSPPLISVVEQFITFGSGFFFSAFHATAPVISPIAIVVATIIAASIFTILVIDTLAAMVGAYRDRNTFTIEVIGDEEESFSLEDSNQKLLRGQELQNVASFSPPLNQHQPLAASGKEPPTEELNPATLQTNNTV